MDDLFYDLLLYFVSYLLGRLLSWQSKLKKEKNQQKKEENQQINLETS